MFILVDKAEVDYVQCSALSESEPPLKQERRKIIDMIVQQHLGPCLHEADSVAVSLSKVGPESRHARLKHSTASKAL